MLEISFDSPESLGDQIVSGIRRLIANGTLKLGDELPSVRQLAADLGVNLNTVARAYRELEAARLAKASRGLGTRITATREAMPNARNASPKTGKGKFPAAASANAAFREDIGRVLTDAKLAGLTPGEVRACIEKLIPHYWKAPPRGNT